ncbi:MAG: bL28 family ribosomal protein [Bacilli bacterium]
MAKKITSKKPLFGNIRSHACNASRHAQKPNLQKITLDNGEAIRVSARELRSMRKDNIKKEITNETA